MNSRDIAFLACRFFALFIVIGMLRIIGTISTAIFYAGLPQALMVIGLIVAIFGLAFLLFWFKAEWIAKKIVGSHRDESITSSPHYEGLQNVGFTIIGMFMLADAVPSIVGSMIMSDPERHPTPDMITYYIENGAAFIIGLLLIIGAKTITKAINRMRDR